jgi:spore coat polysaccharide biosynthesis protein SpsF (cytidylyltransferase family)
MATSRIAGHRVVGVIVARMGSTRLPGKSLMPLAGRAVLGHMIDIARAVDGLDEVCIATSDLAVDHPIAAFAAAERTRCIRGDADRVLDRLHLAVQQTAADIVVYIGGDCPLLDPAVLSAALADFAATPCDYLNNYGPPTFPEGLDVNIVSRAALDRAYSEALAPSQRVHAFSYLTHHPAAFQIRNYALPIDLSAHHWSLDFPEDLVFLNAVYDRIDASGRPISLDAVRRLIETDPVVGALDADLRRGPVQHAFWNSPGIIRDMAEDVMALAGMAREALAKEDFPLAARCFSEMSPIAADLGRFASHKSEQR